MKRMTYGNLMKAIRLIKKKGYDNEDAERLARCKFDECEYNNYSMPVEWYIARILTKAEYDQAYGI